MSPKSGGVRCVSLPSFFGVASVRSSYRLKYLGRGGGRAGRAAANRRKSRRGDSCKESSRVACYSDCPWARNRHWHTRQADRAAPQDIAGVQQRPVDSQLGRGSSPKYPQLSTRPEPPMGACRRGQWPVAAGRGRGWRSSKVPRYFEPYPRMHPRAATRTSAWHRPVARLCLSCRNFALCDFWSRAIDQLLLLVPPPR